MSDEATAAPSENWSGAVGQYMADPYMTLFLQGLEALAKHNAHTVGHLIVEARIVSANSSSAVIRGCIDTSRKDTLDGNGHSIVANSGPGAYWRYIAIGHMTKTSNGWKLAQSDEHRNESC